MKRYACKFGILHDCMINCGLRIAGGRRFEAKRGRGNAAVHGTTEQRALLRQDAAAVRDRVDSLLRYRHHLRHQALQAVLQVSVDYE